MKRTLNVGLIGFGMIGKVHAFGYATLPYYAPELDVVGKIVAVATRRQETAERAKETLGCSFATTDYRQIIASPEIDVVHICTPNGEHLPALLEAIRANKHIYCEKPLVVDGDEARQIREALEERNDDGTKKYRGITQTAFHLRGFAAIRRAKELIDSGRLGQVVQYRVGYYHTSMLSPAAPFRWKHDVKGGSILDLASHLFDLVDYLVGLPSELIAQSTTLCATRPTRALAPGEVLNDVPSKRVLAEDSVVLLTRGLDEASSRRRVPCLEADGIYEHPANAQVERGVMPLGVADASNPAALTGVIEATKLANGAEDDLRLEISGTRGALRFSLMNSHILEFFDGTRPSGSYGGESGWLQIACGGRYPLPESEFPSPKSTTGWVRAHVASLATFYRSIAANTAFGPDFAQALRIQSALDVAKRSSAKRTWERV